MVVVLVSVVVILAIVRISVSCVSGVSISTQIGWRTCSSGDSDDCMAVWHWGQAHDRYTCHSVGSRDRQWISEAHLCALSDLQVVRHHRSTLFSHECESQFAQIVLQLPFLRIIENLCVSDNLPARKCIDMRFWDPDPAQKACMSERYVSQWNNLIVTKPGSHYHHHQFNNYYCQNLRWDCYHY